jgi:hypothetical protein
MTLTNRSSRWMGASDAPATSRFEGGPEQWPFHGAGRVARESLDPGRHWHPD